MSRKSSKPPDAGLSRRERQIMRVLYRRGEATVREVCDAITDGPGYNSVRVTLSILERKGKITHREEGRRYVHRPLVEREVASRGVEGNALDVTQILLQERGKLGVDPTPKVRSVKLAEPPGRKAGEIVPDVETLIAKLHEEAKVF